MIRSGRIRRALRTRSRVEIFSLAFEIGRPGLHPRDVRLLELQLGGVLDRGNSLFVGNVGREHVEEGRLAAARSSRDQDVFACPHARREELDHLGRHGFAGDQVARQQRPGREAADRDQGPVERQGADHRVDAAAVGKTGVDHGTRLVEPPADAAGDPLDDLEHVLLVMEDDVRPLQTAAALDVHGAWPVDEDVGDRRIA